eukprot:Hpha_TRINITY_DN14326_c0_g2::TRINITY_DN14326_c0_g2_i1::g.86783::m.86783/K03363/CDC20; cell division cycle 20, cofactor of APC complex
MLLGRFGASPSPLREGYSGPATAYPRRGLSLSRTPTQGRVSVSRTTDKRTRSPADSATHGKRRALSGQRRPAAPPRLSCGEEDPLAATVPPGRRSRTLLLQEGFDREVAQMNLMRCDSPWSPTGGAGRVLEESTLQAHAAEILFPKESTRMAVASGSVLRHVESPPPLDFMNPMMPVGIMPVGPAARPRTAVGGRSCRSAPRTLPQVADRVLDAPYICADPIMSLIDMSRSCSLMAVALRDAVYTWNGETGESAFFFSSGDNDNLITSVAWREQGPVCAAATSAGGDVQIWDAGRQRRLRVMGGHTERVCALAWSGNVLTSGGRDGKVIHHDVRVKRHKVAELKGHDGEVSAMQYSPDACTLATGGVDGKVLIWDAAPGVVRHKQVVEAHTTANSPVTALGWVPGERHSIVTGGPENSHLRLWGTVSGQLLGSTEVATPVSKVLWADGGELLSAHMQSGNLTLWRLQRGSHRLSKLSSVKAHSDSVTHVVLDGDREAVISCSPDETIRFWKVFDNTRRRRDRSSGTHMLLR